MILWGRTQASPHDRHTESCATALKRYRATTEYIKVPLQQIQSVTAVTADGILPDEDHITVVLHEPPTDAGKLGPFLGLLSWFHL